MAIHVAREWLDQNTARSYPFTVEATQQDLTGELTVPDDFIVGIKLGVHAGLTINPGSFFLKTLGIFTTGFSITIGYDDGGDTVSVATANIARAGFSEFSSYRLIGVGDFIDATGVITIGKLDNIDNQPAGQFEFDLAGGVLETDVVYPIIRGISSLRVLNGNDLSPRLYGDIVIQAGTNMQIDVTELFGQDPVITFNAIDGAGLNNDCVCIGVSETLNPIKRINGVVGTPDGDFYLIGNDCLGIEEINYGLKLNDKCSKPCCGCAELETITAQLEVLKQQVTTYNVFLTDLEAKVSQTDQVILASRLGDRSCDECP